MMWDVKPDQTSSSYQNSAARARSLCGLVLGRGDRLRSKNRGHICSSPNAVCAQGSPGCGVWIPSKGQCRFVPSPQPFSPQLPAGALQSWGVLMHSHPCLKPEELTGIFPSLRGFPPAQIKASFHSVGQGGFPVQSHTWDVSPEHSNICKSFQCLHPFLTPSQLSFGQTVGWSQETPHPAHWKSPGIQPSSAAWPVVSRLDLKSRTARPCWEPAQQRSESSQLSSALEPCPFPPYFHVPGRHVSCPAASPTFSQEASSPARARGRP